MISAREAYRALMEVEGALNQVINEGSLLRFSLGTGNALARAAEFRDHVQMLAEAADRLFTLVRADKEDSAYVR